MSLYPEATLKRAIPGVAFGLEDRTPMKWGMWFLLLFALVIIGRIQEVFPDLGPLRVGVITGGLVVLAWLLAPGSFQDKVPTKLRPVRYVLILLGLAVFTIPISVWPGHSFEFVTERYWKTVLLFLLVVFWCRSVKDIRRLMWVCCLGTIALVVSGLLTGQVGDQRFYADSRTYDPNDLALLLIMMLPLLLYLFSTSRAVMQIVISGLALICLYGIVRTQSRAGLITAVVVGILILWRATLSRTSKAVILLAAVLVFGVLADSAYWDRMATIWDPKTEMDRTGAGRTDVWMTSLVLLATHPWGVGINGFETAQGLSHGGLGEWKAAHNSYLQIGVELGVTGLIVFVLWILRTLKDLRLIQARPKRVPLLAGLRNQHEGTTSPNPLAPLAGALEISLWGFVVGGFFLSQAYSGMLYVVLALGLVCIRLTKENEISAPETKVN